MQIGVKILLRPMYASNEDIHNEDWILVSNTSPVSQAASNLERFSDESSTCSTCSTTSTSTTNSSSDISTPTSSKTSRSLSLASISSTEFDYSPINDEHSSISHDNEPNLIESNLIPLCVTFDESNMDEIEGSDEITPVLENNNSVISNSSVISEQNTSLSDRSFSFTSNNDDNDNKLSCNDYSHQSSSLIEQSESLLSSDADSSNDMDTTNKSHQNNASIISLTDSDNAINISDEQDDINSTSNPPILSSPVQLNDLSSIDDFQLLTELLSQNPLNLSNDTVITICKNEDDDPSLSSSIKLSNALRRRTGPHVRQTSARFDDDLGSEEKSPMDESVVENGLGSVITSENIPVVHDVLLLEEQTTKKTVPVVSEDEDEVDVSSKCYREIRNYLHYNARRHESSQRFTISLDLLVFIAFVAAFFLGIGHLNGSSRISHLTKKLADAEENIHGYKTNEKLLMSEVSQKISKMYDEKVNEMIIRNLQEKLEQRENEKANLLNYIDNLQFMFNLTQINLTKSFDMLKQDHDQLNRDMKLLQERINTTEKQYAQCMNLVKKNLSSSSKCDGIDCDVDNDSNKSIFEKIVQKTSTIIDFNNDTILSNFVSSVNSFVDKRQQYVEDLKSKLHRFNSDHNKNIRTTLTNIKEDLTSSIQQMQNTYSDWLFSRATQRKQLRTELDEKQGEQQRKPWRWTFRRSTLRERERSSPSWKNTLLTENPKVDEQSSSFNCGSRTFHNPHRKFRFPSTNFCWMKKWVDKFSKKLCLYP
ncbi:unnamed protein product [Didymodactylos carnosus]|uniref:Uncharacterized protein n=1 Tax=Didymodactylos carnosus TaxID=1234261 RepID=A0A8S2DX26_9BILA|nr:unnamed protein product [Didymodactylos carnosus]CAF3798263.1 unnamed protein product [Didymodactylos carnosus]